jgi:hypothetical protein
MLSVWVRPKSVEDEREHAGRAVVWAGCGAPERTGELEEVAGVGVRADAPGGRRLGGQPASAAPVPGEPSRSGRHWTDQSGSASRCAKSGGST